MMPPSRMKNKSGEEDMECPQFSYLLVNIGAADFKLDMTIIKRNHVRMCFLLGYSFFEGEPPLLNNNKASTAQRKEY